MLKPFLNHIKPIMGNILAIYVPNVAYISPLAVSYIIKIKEGSRHAERQQAFKEGSRHAGRQQACKEGSGHARKVIFQLFEFGKNLKNSDPLPQSK